MVRHALAAALSAALLGAALLDCNLVLDTSSYSVGTTCPAGDCTCGGFVYASSSCEACSQQSCCDESDQCQKSGPCGTLYDCLSACGATDAACRRACTAKTPVENSSSAAALETCRAAHCSEACTSCGTLADWRSAACTACVASTCCAEASACAGDEACAALSRCYRACTYPSCPEDCDAHAGAASTSAHATALAACLSGTCADACGYGTQWSCVGAFHWPAKVQGTVPYTVHATAFTDGSPMSGVEVRVCDRSDLGCTSWHISGKTNSKGLLTLHVPSGFNGYLDATRSDLAESLFYLSWPVLSDPNVVLQLGSYALYTALVKAGGGNANDTEGGLFVYTRDCLGAPAPGVHLGIVCGSPSSDTEHFYFQDGSPVATLQATATDAIGGFANVFPGNVTLTATLQATGTSLASFIPYIRKKTITFVTLTPTPTP